MYPFIGASPYGYVFCSCCGSGVIEIKCLFCAKDLTINEAANTAPNFCLKLDEHGSMRLKWGHAYYYQVQMQLFVTDKTYCDFVLWTERDCTSPFVERVTPDVPFFHKELACATDFFKICIMPKLIGKYFSAPKSIAAFHKDGQQWCYVVSQKQDTCWFMCQVFVQLKSFIKLALTLKEFLNSGCPSCRKVLNAQTNK